MQAANPQTRATPNSAPNGSLRIVPGKRRQSEPDTDKRAHGERTYYESPVAFFPAYLVLSCVQRKAAGPGWLAPVLSVENREGLCRHRRGSGKGGTRQSYSWSKTPCTTTF